MDPQTEKIIAIVLFVLTYVLLLIFSKRRAFIALGSAILFIAIGILPLGEVPAVINWNLLLMLAGIMGTVCLFIESRMPAAIGDFIIAKMPNFLWAVITLALFSGLISAFIDNVATVLIIAPIAVDISKKSNVSPVGPVIAVAVMSNLQGAATLVGDTTSILLSAEANMNFFDFFFFKGRPGLFWVIQAASVAALLFLVFVFRKDKQKILNPEREKAANIYPSVLLALTVVLLIAASFIPESFGFALTNGLICVTLFIAGLIIRAVKTKGGKGFFKIFRGMDFSALLLIASLFVVIGGIQSAGLIDDLAGLFIKISGNPFIIYTIMVFVSVLLSAFIDNIPYVAAMLPVAAQISASLGIEPYLLYFGLLCGATLGGNLTPIGASANIAALGVLRKEGYGVKMRQFMKISVPFTLIAIATGYVLLWFIWG